MCSIHTTKGRVPEDEVQGVFRHCSSTFILLLWGGYTMRNEKFIKEVKETVQYIKDTGGTKVVDEPSLSFMAVKHSNGDEYVIEGSEYDKFYDEYMNSGLEDDIWFDEYIMYISQNW